MSTSAVTAKHLPLNMNVSLNGSESVKLCSKMLGQQLESWHWSKNQCEIFSFSRRCVVMVGAVWSWWAVCSQR